MARSRHNRARRRVALRFAHLKSESLHLYVRGLCHFLAWILNSDLSLAWDPVRVDRLLSIWIEHCYDCDLPRHLCSHALCGLRLLFPSWRILLHDSHAALRGWSALEPPERTCPIPPAIALATVSWFLLRRDISRALYVWLMFHCMLRPSELMSCRVRDLHLSLISLD